METYKWKIEGLYKVDASIVGTELSKLDNLTPETVLDLARPEDSPLHSMFEWDDTIAAEKYRLSQARSIIQHITIVKGHPRSEPVQVRAFVSSGQRDGSYKPITTVVTEMDSYAKLLSDAKLELQAFKNKYKDLIEFKELFELIDNI